MENTLLFDYGPVWIKKKFKFDDRFMDFRAPVPNGISCGPVISQKSVVANDESQNNNLEDITELREIKNIEIENRNCIARKFPLIFDSFLKPVQNIASQYAFPGDLDKRFHHSNILSSYTLNDDQYIIYGNTSSGSCNLNIASIFENGEDLRLDNINKICNFERLYQSESAVINGSPHVLLRADNALKFIKVNENAFHMCSIGALDVLDCSLNKDLSSRIAFITKDRTLTLFNVEKEEPMWSNQFDVTFHDSKPYLGCEFSYNPSYVNVACESEVFVVDTRLPANNNNCRKIFSIKNMNEYLLGLNENICAMKNVSNQPFLYVTCSDTTALMDSRYCKYPVLTWCHMIKGRPSYSQHFQDYGFDYYLVAEPFKGQLCFISSQSDKAEFPSISAISTPRHLNVINDTFKVARQRGIWFTDRIEREMCSVIVGVNILPMKRGPVIFLQNNNGNLFYVKSVNRRKTSSADNNISTKCLKVFEKSLIQPKCTNKMSEIDKSKVQYIEGLKFTYSWSAKKNIKFDERNWDAMIWNIGSMSKSANYTKLYVKDSTDKKKKKKNSTDEEKKKEDSPDEEKKKKKSLLSHFCTKDQDTLSDEFIKSCFDINSVSFLSVWDDCNEESSDNPQSKRSKLQKLNTHSRTTFKYYNCPHFVNVEDISLPLYSPMNDGKNNCLEDISSVPASSAQENNNLVNIANITTEKSTTIANHNDDNSVLNISAMENDEGNFTMSEKFKIKNKKRKSKSDGF